MVQILGAVKEAVAETGIRTSGRNNRIEVVTPLPLEDLMYMVDVVNQGSKHPDVQNNKLDTLGRGHFGTVWGYKQYAIKYIRDGEDAYSGYGEYRNTDELLDAYILKQLADVESVPNIYAVIDKTAIIIERINGLTLHQYDQQMSDLKKMNNFISVDFLKVYKEAMKDILHAGLMPKDLHSENVMIDRETGLPKIIDVGLFKNIRGSEKDLVRDRDNIDLDEFGSVSDAMYYARRMTKYIDMNTNPQKFEEHKERMKKDAEERERQEIIRKERNRKRAIEDKAVNLNLVVREYGRLGIFARNNSQKFEGEVNHYVHQQHKDHENKEEKRGVMVWKQKNLKEIKRDKAIKKALEEQERMMAEERKRLGAEPIIFANVENARGFRFEPIVQQRREEMPDVNMDRMAEMVEEAKERKKMPFKPIPVAEFPIVVNAEPMKMEILKDRREYIKRFAPRWA